MDFDLETIFQEVDRSLAGDTKVRRPRSLPEIWDSPDFTDTMNQCVAAIQVLHQRTEGLADAVAVLPNEFVGFLVFNVHLRLTDAARRSLERVGIAPTSALVTELVRPFPEAMIGLSEFSYILGYLHGSGDPRATEVLQQLAGFHERLIGYLTEVEAAQDRNAVEE